MAAADPIRRPDVLVLGAGGTLGRAWMAGVLAGVESVSDADYRTCEHFVGTSAGSIVASTLAAGFSPRGPRNGADADDRAPKGERSATDGSSSIADRLLRPVAPLAGVALRAAAPAGAVVRAAMLARAGAGQDDPYGLGQRMERLGGIFDGRLQIVAAERSSGRRVVFGAPGAPDATVAQAVHASCAIPGVFSPVEIGGREYVDGGVWSLTNLDVAPATRGTGVLCLNPCGTSLRQARSLMGAIAPWARSRAAVEALSLRRSGAVVRVVGPDAGATGELGPNLMDRRRTDRVVAAGYRQGRELV